MAATPTLIAAGDGAAGTLTLSGAASGDLLLLLSRDGAADYFTAVTDNLGGTWTKLTSAPNSGAVGRRVEIWSKENSAAITGITATYAGASAAHGALIRINGADTVGPSNSAFQSATLTPTELKITTTVANMLVISMHQANNNTQAQHTSEAGWNRGTTGANGPAWAWRNDLGSGVNDGCTWTQTLSVGNGTGIVSYTPATGPTVTYWNGSAEVPVASVTYWNGATEVPVGSLSVT